MSSGMTDPDTIVAIGEQLGARYVVAGSITSIGNNKLLVISIMDIRNLQQIAGDYQTYNNLSEIRRELPNMAANIIQATRNNTAALPKLAIVPVQLQGSVDQRVVDTLTQLLAIHLIKSGKYSVYPRTKSIEQVMSEHNPQFSGITADENVIGIGYGENPNLVLSVVARRFENINMFNAAIINLLTGAQLVGRSVDYRDINDGVKIMETLSIYLTSTSGEVTQRQQEEEQRQIKLEQQQNKEREAVERQRNKEREAAERKRTWDRYWAEKSYYATRNYWSLLSGYLQWGKEEDAFGGGGMVFLPLHFSPFKFTSLGIEGKAGVFDGFYGSGSITAGLVYPLTENLKIYGDVVLEMGYFGGLRGLLADWATPGLDFGGVVLFGGDGGDGFFDIRLGLEITYRYSWYDGYEASCKLRSKRSNSPEEVIHESGKNDPGLRDEIHPGAVEQ
jgi:hypothetical protein